MVFALSHYRFVLVPCLCLVSLICAACNFVTQCNHGWVKSVAMWI